MRLSELIGIQVNEILLPVWRSNDTTWRRVIHYHGNVALAPVATVINFRANRGAVLIVLLTGNVDAIFCSTLCQKLLLGVLMQEDVQIALDLLGGGPINLAILLLALKRRNALLIPRPAMSSAFFILWPTNSVMH